MSPGLTSRLRRGLAEAWRDIWRDGRISFASPAFAFPVAYALVYGLGALLYADRMGSRTPVLAGAVVGGLAAYVVALGLSWRQVDASLNSRAFPERAWLRPAAAGLVIIGIVAMVAYLIRIGGIPLLMESVEDARVEAAGRGGAALRVTSLLALPGVWLLATNAGASRRIAPGLAAAGITGIVAGLHILTANRAPAFLTFQVALVGYLLGAGICRMRWGGMALLAGTAVALVLAAGAVGGFRLNGTPTTWRDPEIARAVASGNGVALTGEAARNYLVVPIQNFSSTMDAVPRLIPWRLGYTYVQSIVTILPGRQTTFDQDLKAGLGQDYAGGGTVPSLLGESYANFGPLGWIIVPAALGFILVRLYQFAQRQRTVAAWTLYAWVLVHLINATISGIVVANIFPYAAVVILGGAAWLTRRRVDDMSPSM